MGPLNNFWIARSAERVERIDLRMGLRPTLRFQTLALESARARGLIPKETPINCLGYRKDGHPRHPLMLSYEAAREPFVLKG